MSDLSPEELMQYYDGELPPDRMRAVAARLAESPEARHRLLDLEVLGAAVRAAVEMRAESAPDLTESVLRRLDEAPPGQLRVLSGGTKAPVGSPRLAGATAAAIGVLAAAAAVGGLWLTTRGESPAAGSLARRHEPARSAEPAVPPAAGLGAERVAAHDPAVAIETVDFGEKPGSIFMVAGQSEVTPVVWLVDDPAPDGDRMEPL